MVTRTELIKEKRTKEIEDRASKLKSEESDKKWLAEVKREDAKRVRGLLEGELGELLKLVNEKHNAVRLDAGKVWVRPSGQWSLSYLGFKLGFVPKPTYGPTKLLVRILKEAGFTVNLVTESEPGLECYGDGNIRPDGTYHDVYYMEISW